MPFTYPTLISYLYFFSLIYNIMKRFKNQQPIISIIKFHFSFNCLRGHHFPYLSRECKKQFFLIIEIGIFFGKEIGIFGSIEIVYLNSSPRVIIKYLLQKYLKEFIKIFILQEFFLYVHKLFSSYNNTLCLIETTRTYFSLSLFSLILYE